MNKLEEVVEQFCKVIITAVVSLSATFRYDKPADVGVSWDSWAVWVMDSISLQCQFLLISGYIYMKKCTWKIYTHRILTPLESLDFFIKLKGGQNDF